MTWLRDLRDWFSGAQVERAIRDAYLQGRRHGAEATAARARREMTERELEAYIRGYWAAVEDLTDVSLGEDAPEQRIH